MTVVFNDYTCMERKTGIIFISYRIVQIGFLLSSHAQEYRIPVKLNVNHAWLQLAFWNKEPTFTSISIVDTKGHGMATSMQGFIISDCLTGIPIRTLPFQISSSLPWVGIHPFVVRHTYPSFPDVESWFYFISGFSSWWLLLCDNVGAWLILLPGEARTMFELWA